MVNVTISVPEELKAEMDQFSEVSWSQICREAISRYIATRKHPTPNIELSIRYYSFDPLYHESGYPVLDFSLGIHNKMDIEIEIDRMLYNVSFWKGSTRYSIGSGNDLHKITVGPNSTISRTTYLILHSEKIESLQTEFDSSFDCHVRYVIFVEGFRQPYNSELRTRIAIDDWMELVHSNIGMTGKPRPETL